ncbi:unnamed protein product [Oppiella nova]|uniref:WW domain-containing protein n=1 Tax=Oppiella nova TaxID=334625 RepID=A0A7R9M1U3_9ACAR|nr:unnamed protein product [Oppiella nova]CAG2169071.1 unnamed protein product [Oppiella nova]
MVKTFAFSHETKTTSWLPPIESWKGSDDQYFPYGWESAVDKDGKAYYINCYYGMRYTLTSLFLCVDPMIPSLSSDVAFR